MKGFHPERPGFQVLGLGVEIFRMWRFTLRGSRGIGIIGSNLKAWLKGHETY